MTSSIGKAAIAAVALVCTAILAKNAHAACAAAEGSGTGYNTAHASQLAQFDAMRAASKRDEAAESAAASEFDD